MITVIVLLIVFIVGIIIFSILKRNGSEWSDWEVPLGLCVAGAIICIITIGGIGYAEKAAEYKARIINREYGTNYTWEEIFYASAVIDTIQELNRKRIEINGNLLKTKE